MVFEISEERGGNAWDNNSCKGRRGQLLQSCLSHDALSPLASHFPQKEEEILLQVRTCCSFCRLWAWSCTSFCWRKPPFPYISWGWAWPLRYWSSMSWQLWRQAVPISPPFPLNFAFSTWATTYLRRYFSIFFMGRATISLFLHRTLLYYYSIS